MLGAGSELFRTEAARRRSSLAPSAGRAIGRLKKLGMTGKTRIIIGGSIVLKLCSQLLPD
jgi:hypothetical protein